MVNEAILKVEKTDGLIVKLDFSKAYDSIDLSCLLHILDCINMGKKWTSWIRAILSSSKISVLVNGSPIAEFSPCKGVRQGDPLAPYLFLLIGEVLSKLITRSMDEGVIKGIKFPFHHSPISHFQYADDSILSLKIERALHRELSKCFCYFQSITGLLVNFSKSKIYHSTNDALSIESVAQLLGCQSRSLPFNYQGDWVGLEYKSCSLSNSLTSQLNRSLQGGNIVILIGWESNSSKIKSR